MSEKFTPGPWNVDPSFRFDIQAGDLEVASVAPSILCGGVGNPSDSECKANALLIAAAPDLYHILSRVVEVIDSGFDLNQISTAITIARHYLAKARGETP